MKLLVIGFNDRRLGHVILDDLEFAGEAQDLQSQDLALVYRSDGGRMRIHHTSDVGSPGGLVRGGLLGLLAAIAVSAGPVASGALAGVIAGVGDDAVNNSTIRSLAYTIDENIAVVLALTERAAFDEVNTLTVPAGAEVQVLDVPEATVRLLRELSKLSLEDIDKSRSDRLTPR